MTEESMRNAQERMVGEKECRLCIFSSNSMLTDTDEVWECRRHPPTVQPNGSAEFPMVEFFAWCGEFIPYPPDSDL